MTIICNSLLYAAALLIGLQAAAQSDTGNIAHHSDSTYWIVTNKLTKNKLLGNAFYLAGSFNLARINELQVNIGRSYVKSLTSGAGTLIWMRSWGLGAGTTTRKAQQQYLLNVFAEYSFFYFPPYTITARADYIYLPETRQQYLRPSFGLNLLLIDFLYNYSFKLNGSDNLFRHGFTMRVKYFTHKKKWENRRPFRC